MFALTIAVLANLLSLFAGWISGDIRVVDPITGKSKYRLNRDQIIALSVALVLSLIAGMIAYKESNSAQERSDALAADLSAARQLLESQRTQLENQSEQLQRQRHELAGQSRHLGVQSAQIEGQLLRISEAHCQLESANAELAHLRGLLEANRAEASLVHAGDSKLEMGKLLADGMLKYVYLRAKVNSWELRAAVDNLQVLHNYRINNRISGPPPDAIKKLEDTFFVELQKGADGLVDTAAEYDAILQMMGSDIPPGGLHGLLSRNQEKLAATIKELRERSKYEGVIPDFARQTFEVNMECYELLYECATLFVDFDWIRKLNDGIESPHRFPFPKAEWTSAGSGNMRSILASMQNTAASGNPAKPVVISASKTPVREALLPMYPVELPISQKTHGPQQITTTENSEKRMRERAAAKKTQ